MTIIPEDSFGTRLDQYLAAKLPELSRARIQALLKDGSITVKLAGTVPTIDIPVEVLIV